jgi:cytochrome b561
MDMRRIQLTQDHVQAGALILMLLNVRVTYREYFIGVEIVNDLDIIQKKAVVS